MPTEEQTSWDSNINVGKGSVWRNAQKLIVPNRTITHLGFWLSKIGNPTADLYFGIWRASDGALMGETLWGPADNLDGAETYKELELHTPIAVNEEVYIGVRATSVQAGDYARCAYDTDDVKADEFLTIYTDEWIDFSGDDLAYIYTYGEPAPAAGFGRGVAAVAQALGV